MDPVAEVKRKLDLAEYVGRSVQLHRAGRNLRGLCPFHAEKTPSFYVFSDRGSWRCFGACGEGGDLFSFVQKQRGLDFGTALRELAAEAGVALRAVDPGKRSRDERLARAVSAAVAYYERELAGAAGDEARSYLFESRGLAPDTVAEFHVGWAPEGWRGLRDHLVGRGFEEAELVAAGLLVEPEERGREPYDRFRGRLIVPITAEDGVFIGLGGRALHGEEPKYLNSPQGEIFDKGRTLFGLGRARDAIRETGTAVVVEGYMDVIGTWQAGARNVVATLGTSLTEQHVGLLRRFAHRVVLALDPDAAGLAAAERAGDLFLSLASPETIARSARSTGRAFAAAALDLRVAVLPAGRDPDEIALADPAQWRRVVERAQPFAEFAIARALGTTPPSSTVERGHVFERLGPLMATVADPVERALYVQRIARFVGVPETAVSARFRPRRAGGRPAVQATADDRPAREEILLAILLGHDELRARMRSLPPDLFTDSANRELFVRWLHEEGPGLEPEERDEALEERRRQVLAIRVPPLGEESARRAAGRKVEEILRERLIQRQATVAAEVADAERTLGASQVAAISHNAWMGAMPADEVAAVAQAVIEELELGLSIHRHEALDLP